LRHEGPIREVTFLNKHKLLITTSDDSVRLWDGLSGALRKEIRGQVIRPLFFSDMDGGPDRFVTIDAAGRSVTTWDATTLEPIGSFRSDEGPRLIGAGLSGDGKTLATVGEDRSVTLRDVASKQPYATLRPPSGLVVRVFPDDPGARFWPDTPTLQLDPKFWESVRPLAPAKPEPKKE
jgi:WD40 repeat protein